MSFLSGKVLEEQPVTFPTADGGKIEFVARSIGLAAFENFDEEHRDETGKVADLDAWRRAHLTLILAVDGGTERKLTAAEIDKELLGDPRWSQGDIELLVGAVRKVNARSAGELGKASKATPPASGSSGPPKPGA